MKRRMKRLTALVLSIGMMLSMTITSGAVTIDEAQKKADELQSQKNTAQSEKDKLAANLNSIIEKMNKTQEELSAKETEISAAENELVQAKVDEDNQYNSMKKRIKFMYEGGNTQFIEILMSSSDIGDLLNKAEYVSKLSSYDRDMLTAFQETVKSVEEKEAKLKDEYEKLNTLQSSLVSQQTEAQNLISSKEAQIAEIQDQITDNANLLADLKAKAEEAKRLQEEQAAAAAAAAAAAKKNNSGSSNRGNSSGSSSSGSGSSSSTPASSGNVVSGSGYFTHPCPGMSYQSSYFGEVRSFESRPHKGNDYAAPTGTPTYAAAAGTVITAGWSNSAGNWVVISHGNGLVTKYMHHSSICVSAGQKVAKGQQIGYVGSTGNSTGPHLHFQVELNGVAVNPGNYF